LTLVFEDIYLPGPNGFDLKINRVYNSKIVADRLPNTSWAIQQEPYSWVGLGWSLHMGRLHNYTSQQPIVEFPDGRWESFYPSKNGNNFISHDFLKYDQFNYKLYFKDGTVWTFGEMKNIVYANGYIEPIRVVTKIENTYGHKIIINYFANSANIKEIIDSLGRVISLEVDNGSSTLPKLRSISYRNASGDYSTYFYNVKAESSWGGYYKLTSFKPPVLDEVHYAYNNGILR